MVVWDGGATDFGRLNGARWSARFTIRIVFIWDVGRRSIDGLDDFRRWRVSWLRGRDSKPTAVELRGLFLFELFQSLKAEIIY